MVNNVRAVHTWRAMCWVTVSARRVERPFQLIDCISAPIKLKRGT
jgi:hypothetical protein